MNPTSTLVRPQQVLIECLIQPDANGLSLASVQFSDATDKFLLNRKVIALNAIHGRDCPLSPINPNTQVLTGNFFTSASISLLCNAGNGIGAGDWYRNIPLSRLRRQYNGALQPLPCYSDEFRINPVTISWKDSTINFGKPQAMGTSTQSVLILCTYLLPEQDPEPYTIQM